VEGERGHGHRGVVARCWCLGAELNRPGLGGGAEGQWRWRRWTWRRAAAEGSSLLGWGRLNTEASAVISGGLNDCFAR
jgi:hypothetical protein